MHVEINPAILYFGTPVVLISTLNEDCSPNLAPMSSAWWLRSMGVLGLDPTSKTTENLLRSGECVLNLPSVEQVAQVDPLALLTGTRPPPPHKLARGYLHEARKFEAAGLTPVPSACVKPPRAAECPVHLEALLEEAWPAGGKTFGAAVSPLAVAVRIVRVHVEEKLIAAGYPNRIDPDRWRPLIMSFQQFYGLGARLHPSRLASIPEESYRRRPAKPA